MLRIDHLCYLCLPENINKSDYGRTRNNRSSWNTLKAVVICHRIPYPPNKGDKIRSYNIIKFLSKFYQIYLFFLIDSPEDVENLTPLESISTYIHYDFINSTTKKALSSLALVSGRPISTKYFYSSKLQKAIDHVLEKNNIDIVFCFSSPTAEYLFRSPVYEQIKERSKLVMDLIDVDSEKWWDYSKRSKWPQSLIYKLEAKYLLKYEFRIANEFDNVFLVSEEEKGVFLKKVEASNIAALPNGVDLEFFSRKYKSRLSKENPTLTFTGVMNYWPNVDGVIWFADKVFPKVREVFPTCEFFIVGKDPSKEVKALAERPGIKVTGFVEDVRDYLAIADVCIVPLNIARGIQNKILEAMSMGKPVITTSRALEGICAVPGRDVLVADNPSNFAQHIISLLSKPELISQFGKKARICVEEKYSWQTAYQILSNSLGLALTQ